MVVRILLEDPRLDLGATIGKRDSIEIVFDHRLSFCAACLLAPEADIATGAACVVGAAGWAEAGACSLRGR